MTDQGVETIKNDIIWIKDNIKEIKTKLEADYITKAEFDPIKKLVYGMVALILTAVVVAIISLVIVKQ